MNKKEIAEIKKQFKFGNEAFTIYGYGIYHAKAFNIEANDFKKFADLEDLENGRSSPNTWDELEETCFLDITKKTFSGSLGKALVEYNFPDDILLDTSADSVYKKLNKVLDNFTKENALEYATFLASKISLESEYAILITKASYSVPQKDVNGEKMDLEFSEGESYDFLVVSICPIENGKPALMLDNSTSKVVHQPISRMILQPLQGFVYPTFNERMTDVNSVLVFNKKPKQPCTTLIEDCLGCTYELNPEDEQTRFNNLVNKLTDGETVEYEISKSIHEQISDIIENTSVNTEITELDKGEILKIFKNSGMSEENLKKFDEAFEDEIGDYSLKAVNLVEANKMNIKSPDIVVNVKNNSLDKVKSQTIDGRKCLVIEIDENVEINGMNVNIKKE